MNGSNVPQPEPGRHTPEETKGRTSGRAAVREVDWRRCDAGRARPRRPHSLDGSKPLDDDEKGPVEWGLTQAGAPLN